MYWVKGELLNEIDAAGVDPSAQLIRTAQPGLFDRIEWFGRVIQNVPAGTTPIIARAASEASLAWLFLMRSANGAAVGLSNWYCMAFRPVYAGNPDDPRKLAMLIAMARRLRSARPRISSISLSPVPRADGNSAMLTKAFTRAGWRAVVQQSSTSWTANVDGLSFDDYWAARPGQLRSTWQRKMGKATFETQIYSDFNQDAWAEYESVYADSWKPSEGSPSFLLDFAQSEAVSGCTRIGITRIDGVAIAAQFWTVENDTAYIHKLAHRENSIALSPGTILSAALFRHVIDVDHVKTIDFGTGNDAYKADWMDVCMPLDTIIIYNLGTLKGVWGAFRAWIKALVKGDHEQQ